MASQRRRVRAGGELLAARAAGLVAVARRDEAGRAVHLLHVLDGDRVGLGSRRVAALLHAPPCSGGRCGRGVVQLALVEAEAHRLGGTQAAVLEVDDRARLDRLEVGGVARVGRRGAAARRRAVLLDLEDVLVGRVEREAILVAELEPHDVEVDVGGRDDQLAVALDRVVVVPVLVPQVGVQLVRRRAARRCRTRRLGIRCECLF
mmetsp:Transcript_43908/g.121608  ORF Transcript_43908/g.121608 Transcript_43908/m.121608 type:complete len:205 (-) Transcript_43908:514-1128(-)